jgi:hypothetical protein
VKTEEKIYWLGKISICEKDIIIWQRERAGPSILIEISDRIVREERSARKPTRSEMALELHQG